MAGANVAPGIRFTTGQSHQEARQFAADLGEIKKQLQGIREEAKHTASALNDVLRGAKGSRGTSAAAPTGGQPRQAGTRRQASPAANAERNIFAGMIGNAGMSDAEWREVGRKQQKRREEALKAGMELSPTERREYSRTRAVNASLRAGRGEAAQGLLARGMSALSWSPFMPQSVYYGQMALEALGLPLGLVAGGMGLAGLGAAGLTLNAYATAQAHTGQQLYAAAGSPFVPDTYATGAAEANLLRRSTGATGLNLPGNEGQQAVSGLAAGGLSGAEAFGSALDQTATLVNAFGMSVQDATGMVGTMRTTLGESDRQVAAGLEGLAKVSAATNTPLAQLGQIAQGTTNFLADLSPDQYGAAAYVLRAAGGTTQNSIALGNLALASGTQAMSLAAQLGMSDPEFDRAQQSAAGLQRITSGILGIVRSTVQQSGGAMDQAMVQINGRFGTDWTKAQIQRLATLPPNTTPAALQQALQAATPPLQPGSAANVAALIAAGNFAGASTAANPPSVPSMTVNAAQVFLTGALSQVGTALGVSTNANGYDVATLRRIAAQGGVAGIAATAALVGRGQTTTTPPSAAMQAIQAAGVNLPPSQYPLQAPPPSAPGNGGGGQVITINLQTDGRQIASLPVQIGPNQQFQQYVPTWHAPGRGPQ